MSVTNASVIYQEVMLRCAIFWFKWFQGSEVSENNFQNVFTSYIDNTDENVTKYYFYILSFPERENYQGEVVLVIPLP